MRHTREAKDIAVMKFGDVFLAILLHNQLHKLTSKSTVRIFSK